jgi:hypothetical protein
VSRFAKARTLWVLAAAGVAAATSGYGASLGLSSKSLTAPRTCVLTANPATSTAAIDSAVQQGSATTNFGTATSMNVTSSSGANRRAYIRFDLTRCAPSIPANATVTLATLRIYASAIPNACRTHDVFRVTASWTEAAITWNNQPFGTTVNNPAQASRTTSYAVGSAPCTNSAANAYVTGALVTSDVQGFVSGALSNFGWMIRDDVEDSATNRASTFSTKNLGTLAQSPQLVTTWVPA